MKTFLLSLRKILLCDIVYFSLLFITIIYILIYINNYVPHRNKEKYLIVTSYYIDGNKLSLELKNKYKYIGNYNFETEEEKNNFKINIGDTVKINGEYNIPNNNTIPNTFNYKKYLLSKRIDYVIKINSFEIINNTKNIFYKFKNFITKRIEKINNNEYLYAFILGTSKYLNEDVYNNYKINTVTHLFALSGLHVSIFSMIVMFILKRFKLSEINILIITSIILFLVCFVSSYTPSILRATIFYILSNLNKIYYTFVKSVYILFITFIILVIINPFYIYNLGFVLSFSITFFILYSNQYYKINNNILSTLFISIISFVGSVPIIINNFYSINIIGFINNIFFIPLVSYLVYPLSLLTVIITPFNGVLSIFTSVMEKVSLISSKLLNLPIILSKMNIWIIIIYYMLYLLIIKYKNKMLMLLLLILMLTYNINIKKETIISFLDVGQGDSILIKTNNNKSILIDTGGREEYYTESWKVRNKKYSIAISSIIPYLYSINIKSIDYLIFTHGDADHIGESINLVNNIKVKNVIFNKGNYNNLETKLIELLNNKNIKYYQSTPDVKLDNIEIKFLNDIIYNNENDNSIVTYIDINDFKLLLMGDASSIVEKNIIKEKNIKDIDILKLGHHGSNTSSSEYFINTIKPKYSVISVGANNKYNHPNIEVLNRLKNSILFRTDTDGSIIFRINNNSLKIENYS